MPKMVCLAGNGRAKCGSPTHRRHGKQIRRGRSGLRMPKVDMRVIKGRRNSVMWIKIGRLPHDHVESLHMPPFAQNLTASLVILQYTRQGSADFQGWKKKPTAANGTELTPQSVHLWLPKQLISYKLGLSWFIQRCGMSNTHKTVCSVTGLSIFWSLSYFPYVWLWTHYVIPYS